jgi:hypothetical protein
MSDDNNDDEHTTTAVAAATTTGTKSNENPIEAVENCVLAVATVDDAIQAELQAKSDVPDLASMSTAAFEDWLLKQASSTIEKSFPQLHVLLPLIESRRTAVRALNERVASERKAISDDNCKNNNNNKDDTVAVVDQMDDSVQNVSELRRDIELRRGTAALLKEATESLVKQVGSVAGSGDVQLKRLLDSDAQTRAAVSAGVAMVPSLLQRIPSMTYASLAEENARNEQSVLSRLFNARVDFLQASRAPVSIRWWGATVDLTHDDVQRIFTGTAWLGSISSLLGRLLAGEPNAVLLSVIMRFVAFYGIALAHIDRGRGIRFCVPWLAVSPLPNPLLILPTPL